MNNPGRCEGDNWVDAHPELYAFDIEKKSHDMVFDSIVALAQEEKNCIECGIKLTKENNDPENFPSFCNECADVIWGPNY